MVAVTLILPLNKGQGHSFWYHSISYIRLPGLSIITFAGLLQDAPFSHNTTLQLQTDDDDRRNTGFVLITYLFKSRRRGCFVYIRHYLIRPVCVF